MLKHKNLFHSNTRNFLNQKHLISDIYNLKSNIVTIHPIIINQ